MDASGHCVCTVILPDDTFPLQRIELLETSARNLTFRVHWEMKKVRLGRGRGGMRGAGGIRGL